MKRTQLFATAMMFAFLIVAGVLVLRGGSQRAAAAAESWHQQTVLAAIARVWPGGYTNDPLADRRTIADPGVLGLDRTAVLYPLNAASGPVGAAIELSAIDAYNGPIRIVVGADRTGTVTGVLVLEHGETPGFGDAIEAIKSAWCDVFKGVSLSDTVAEDWRTRAAGGRFDAISGATITSRAMINGVHDALRVLDAHGTVSIPEDD